MVFRKEDQKIAVGSPVELSTKDYAEKLMKLEEGTIFSTLYIDKRSGNSVFV